MNPPQLPRPVVFLVSAPSGAGKTTLCRRLLEAEPNLCYSVSCTTRPPREGERDGVDYFFLTRGAFEAEAAAGEFLEHAEVHGHFYGTRVSFLKDCLERGKSVLLDVDVQGAGQIRKKIAGPEGDPVIRSAFADVFVFPPSPELLRARLEGRGTDAAEVVARRLENAEAEMRQAGAYMFQLVNRDLEVAFRVFHAIFLACAHRASSSPLSQEV